MLASSSMAGDRATATPAVRVLGSDPAVADCLTYLRGRSTRTPDGRDAIGATSAIVVFLERHAENARQRLDELVRIVKKDRPEVICLVSTFRIHFGDTTAEAIESLYVRHLQGLTERLVVFRPGHLISDHSRLGVQVRRRGILWTLLPRNLTSCFVTGDELFAAIDRALEAKATRRVRIFTLLGRHQPWRELAAEPCCPIRRRYRGVLRALVAVLLIGPLTAGVIRFLARVWPTLAALNFSTLRPKSIKELLTLYNPYNHQHVKVVGYNNGVVHFGHRYPDRTIVSTVHCNQLARVRGNSAEFDCGVTIKQAMAVLGAAERELHVLPNYSYVTLGTAFFVPIHGSASKFCTVGETAESAILYDAAEDRVLPARAFDPVFGKYLYNLSADVLLLRLGVQVKEKSHYYVKQETVTNPPAAEVWAWFHDASASNVEVRKAGSRTDQITVYRYYAENLAGPSGGLEVPRDRLGRLWDRLEENPITSLVFHDLSRVLAHHVELFLSEDEFCAFWETHGKLSIAKIQLRFIKKDGFPNSPFRDHDCISADLFMLKKHRSAFDAYLKQTLPGVKMNPGKHSI